MKALLQGRGPDYHEISREVEHHDLFREALSLVNGAQLFGGTPIDVSVNLVKWFLPGAYANLRPHPIHVHQIDQHWVTVSWNLHTADNYHSDGFLFGYRSGDRPFEYMQIDEGVVDHATGDLSIPFGTLPHGPHTLRLVFPAYQNPWPYPLLGLMKDPVWVAHGTLNTILEPGNENALTALLQSKDSTVRFAARNLSNLLKAAEHALRSR